MAARAAAAAADARLDHTQRVGVLERLDRRVARVRHVRLQRRRAVPAGPGAVAAAERLVVGERPAGARIDAADQQVVHGAAARRRNAPGQRARERAEHHVDDALRGLDVARRRPRRAAARSPRVPGGATTSIGAERAVVHREVAAEHAAQRVVAPRRASPPRPRSPGPASAGSSRVKSTRARPPPERERAPRSAPARCRARRRRARPRSEHVPRGSARKRGAHAALGVVHQRAPRRARSVAAPEPRAPSRRGARSPVALRAELRGRSARRSSGGAHVGEHAARSTSLRDHAGAHETHRRDAQALLVDLARERHRARRRAADVGVMRAARDDEVGRAAPGPRNTGETSVTSGRCVPPANGSLSTTTSPRRERAERERRLDRARHAAEVHRNVRRLRDQPARAVEDRARVVEPLLDVRRVRGAHERRAHLLGGTRRTGPGRARGATPSGRGPSSRARRSRTSAPLASSGARASPAAIHSVAPSSSTAPGRAAVNAASEPRRGRQHAERAITATSSGARGRTRAPRKRARAGARAARGRRVAGQRAAHLERHDLDPAAAIGEPVAARVLAMEALATSRGPPASTARAIGPR